METKFNFNSQVCTSKEQSERLLALGLKKETADMTWFRRSKNADWESCTISYKEWVEEILPIVDGYTLEDIIPAWSLHRLIETTPSDMRGYMCKNIFDEKYAIDEQFDELIATIGYYIKEGYFQKEYLV